MTKVLQRVELTLRSLYIFNSKFYKKEGEEHKKILYYYPNDIELNTKIKDVGLSEAIIAFSGTFTSEDHCKALHTQKTTQIFYQPELGFWMVIVLNVPKIIRSKDGVEVTDYRGAEVHDRIYRAVLEKTYNMFRLFNGNFQMNMKVENEDDAQNERGRQQLLQRLALFFDKHLLSLKLPVYDIHVLPSIQYLPLNKFLFLRAHNFINVICATFPVIRETILLYNEQQLCSGKIDPTDLFTLHDYIVGTLLIKVEEGSGAILTRSDSTTSNIYRNGAFITGPEDSVHEIKLPKVYLKKDETLQPYYLIVFRALNATLCIFVSGNEIAPLSDFYIELQTYMGPQLTTLARDIEDSLSKGNGKPTTLSTSTALASSLDADAIAPKYIFVNEKSLKHLTNIPVEQRRPQTAQGSILINLIADLANDNDNQDTSSPAIEEVIIKTTNDFWIVKRRCNWRQYYVIILKGDVTLMEVTQEAKRLLDQELINDVFFDK